MLGCPGQNVTLVCKPSPQLSGVHIAGHRWNRYHPWNATYVFVGPDGASVTSGFCDLPEGLSLCLSVCVVPSSSELNRNRVRQVEGLTFQGLASLEVLKLQRNNISKLTDGAFWGLAKMKVL